MEICGFFSQQNEQEKLKFIIDYIATLTFNLSPHQNHNLSPHHQNNKIKTEDPNEFKLQVPMERVGRVSQRGKSDA